MPNLLTLFPNSQAGNPNVLLQGPDAFLNDYLAHNYVSQPAFQGLERVTVDCESDPLDDLIAALAEASLFSQRKLVLVKNPLFLTGKFPAKYKQQAEQLLEIFTHIDQLDDVVVLVASYEKLDRRKKLTKQVEKSFNTVSTAVKSYDSGRWMKALVKAEGYRFDRGALELLMERSDQVLDTALGNYNKLKAISAENEISLDLVDRNIDLSLDQNVFAILEAAMKGNYQEAIDRLDGQLREGTYPLQLVAVFFSQVEFLLCVKVMGQRRRSESEIAKELAAHPYRVKTALKSRAKIPQLERMLAELIQLDYRYKNGTYRDSSFLKMFILAS
ncbi:DNA polymerase III subunit delta [Lactobacillus nasalidis]|uniref:DNA polymerase III subunit delta n=1 Tax=Lactobacillus nasalidis TaxID=2797258 RepID=A0ABQ3W699_9LACO|nr:DNA polymerase III subunit delta [Lactobacillus nasalidis]GHV98110.1 DNA polymerase III subunit delta [Lactobacillus nasalidis]GHV99214.1 DNA polymerase III subunit delta [Lactobacillus nasalidis]GHW00624.1 DNA polymerase III subunit delta [Lactobacillus nasalidis]